MPGKKGTLLPISGTLLPDAARQHLHTADYGAIIAAALHREFERTHGATKTVMGWTGASERTVKNWFAGNKGPNGMHLAILAGRSDAVFETFLHMTGRKHPALQEALSDTRERVMKILDLLDQLAPRGDLRDSRGQSH